MTDIRISFGGAGIRQMTQEVKALQKELRQITTNTAMSSKAMQEFAKSGKQFQSLGKNVKALTKEMAGLGATLKQQVDMKSQAQDTKEFALSMINLRDAGSAFVIIAQQMGQALDESREEFREFNNTMQQVATLATKTGEAVDASVREKMTAAVNQLALETGKDSREIAMSLREIVAMGFEGEDAMLLLEAGTFAAVAGLGEVADTGELVVNVIRAFGLEADNANSVAAQLTFIANETSLQMDEMGIAMQFAAAQAGIMGFDLAEVAAVLGLMRDAGVKASRAGTSLRQFLVRLADPTSEARDLMEGLGITFADAEGNFLSLTEIMQNTIRGLEGMTDVQKAQIVATLFEVRGQTALNLVQAQGIGRLQELTEGAREFTNEEEAMSFLGEITNKMLDSQAVALDKSEERLRQASRVIAENTTPAIISMNDAQSFALELLGNFPPVVQAAGGVIAQMGVKALESAGNIFLMVTSFETGGKQIGRLITKFKNLDGVQKLMNSRIGQSIGRLKNFKLAAIGAGLALGGVAVGMAAVTAEGETERAVLSVLTGVMFALAAASVAAAIAKEAVRSHPLVAAALAVVLGAAIAAVVHTVASQAAAARAVSREGEAAGAQRGAFIAASPGRGTLLRVGEGVQSELVLPEPMLRSVVREELEKIFIHQDITQDQFNFYVPPFSTVPEREARKWADVIVETKRRDLRVR